MKIFIFNIDTIFREADGLHGLNRIPRSRSTINPYLFEEGSLQDCYTLNKKRMGPIFKAILENGNKIGFATSSTSTKIDHIKIFFAMEYGLALGDDFICFPRATYRINTYLKEAAKLFQLQHANIIFIDDNEYLINKASEDGFTVIHVDSNKDCNTDGTVYVKKLEEVLRNDNSREANNPVAAQTQMELKLAPPLKIFMFDIDETLLCWKRKKCLNDIPHSETSVNPYREFLMVVDDMDDLYDEDTDDDTDDKCYTLNKANMKPIIQEIRKQGHKMGFITAGKLRREHIKEFFQFEYALDLGNNFIHYCGISDKTHYLKKIALKYELSREKIILIDDNHLHITSAREAGFTTILVDSLKERETHGTEYIRMLKMELGLQVDHQLETNHEEKKPVETQTEPPPFVEISVSILQTETVRSNEEKLPSQSIITIQHDEMTSLKDVELSINSDEQSVKASASCTQRFFKTATNTTVDLFTCCLPCFKRSKPVYNKR